MKIADLGPKAPQYKENLKQKFDTFKSEASGPLLKVKQLMSEVRENLNVEVPEKPDNTHVSPTPDQSGVAPGTIPEKPLWTKVVAAQLSPLELLGDSVNPLLGPLGTLSLVLILSLFVLINREDLRDRLIRLLGEQRMNVTTDALDESASKVGTYLLMQLIVNVSYGFPVYLGLFLIGIPSAALWGVLATVLRFLPYIGPWIAAAFPIALSFAISTSWTLSLYTIGVFIVLELISNNLIEPWLYGKNTGLSPVAVLVAAIFWTWMWGTVGLILSTPLTVCLVVLGK